MFPPTGKNYGNKSSATVSDSSFAKGTVKAVWTMYGWDLLRGNQVLETDPRYAWTILYRRDGDPNDDPTKWSPEVELFVIVAQLKVRRFYELLAPVGQDSLDTEIGRASCRERV